MEDIGLEEEKPVIVRVKRKASQMPLDALWLEINERPLKRTQLDFGNLSTSTSSAVKEDLKTKKLLVQHVETVSSSEGIENALQSFMPNSANAKEFRMKLEERRCSFKQEKQRQEQLRSEARQKHEDFARNARFIQLWKSRKGNKEGVTDSFHECCHLYDVLRVDNEVEITTERQEMNFSLLENDTVLCNYVPLLREFLPTAAAELESDVKACLSQQDGYVYDLYTMGDDSNSFHEDDLTMYPLVQVDDDDCNDYYEGPIRSEFESDDSNDEDNPRNDYPDEESSEDDGHENRSSNDQSEHDELENRSPSHKSEQENYMYEEDIVDDDEEGDWRWEYR